MKHYQMKGNQEIDQQGNLTHTSNINMIEKENVQKTLPVRDLFAHKGSFGMSFLITGSDEMPGSALLAATGAIRSGTGKVLIGTTKRVATIIAPVLPEATYMVEGLDRVSNKEVPDKITAVGIGPGITDEQRGQLALNQLMNKKIPIVVDAGALTQRDNWNAQGPIILTPHPGEMARLTGQTIHYIQANRVEIAQAYATKHHVFIVLKGYHTVIACPDGEVLMNPTGNTGLAKGGSGDVLTGMLVSMLTTHEKVKNAVINAVYIHGLCADKWAETYSESSMVASDFNMLLPKVLKEIETSF